MRGKFAKSHKATICLGIAAQKAHETIFGMHLLPNEILKKQITIQLTKTGSLHKELRSNLWGFGMHC